jgi:hypothetical protein
VQAIDKLNGYSWVEGDPINMIDRNGQCGEPILPIAIEGLFKLTPCSMRDSKSGVDVLAYTAARETAERGSTLRNSGHAKAALMLMQINAFRTPNRQGSVENWTTLGIAGDDLNPQGTFIHNALTQSDATLSEKFLARLCSW